ncbi:MAG: phosphatase PAP2 family protein [Anaerolineales bacterium]
MGGYWDWGVGVVLWLQTNAGGLKPFMQALSFLGTEDFLLVLSLTLYWCVDVSLGLRLGLLLTIGGSLGSLLKLAFHMPRPYWYDPRVQPMASEPTYGMPSGHSITAWSVGPWLGSRIQMPWGLAAGVLIALGVSVSRVFLGVHFPGDVLAGLLVGLIVWFIVDWSIRHIGPVLKRAGFLAQCGAAVATSTFLLLAQAGLQWGIRFVVDPPEWAQNASRLTAVSPRNPTEFISLAGLVLGLGAGLAFQQRWAQFRADGPAGKRVLRFLLGLSVMLIVWRGLPILWNEYVQPASMVLRYIRYALVGFWAVFLAPLIFLRLGLAGGEK